MYTLTDNPHFKKQMLDVLENYCNTLGLDIINKVTLVEEACDHIQHVAKVLQKAQQKTDDLIQKNNASKNAIIVEEFALIENSIAETVDQYEGIRQ